MLEKYELSVKDWQQYQPLAPAANREGLTYGPVLSKRKEVSWGIYMSKPLLENKSRRRGGVYKFIRTKIRHLLTRPSSEYLILDMTRLKKHFREVVR